MTTRTRNTERISHDALPDALKAALDDRDWSLRELWRQIERKNGKKSISIAGIHAISVGDLNPTISSMEKIASGLGIKPEYFAEYRLAVARRDLDPEVVGLAEALAHLHG